MPSARFGMSSQELLAIFEAIPKDGITAKQLAAKLNISQTTVWKRTRKLESKKLIVYRRSNWFWPDAGKFFKKADDLT